MKPIDTNISKGFEHKICQFGRLEYAMEKRGIDALVITQKAGHNNMAGGYQGGLNLAFFIANKLRYYYFLKRNK